jgi:hypothetical protein
MPHANRNLPPAKASRRRWLLVALPMVTVVAAVTGCITTVSRVQSSSPTVAYDTAAPFLKAHLRTGEVVLFSTWAIDSSAGTLEGVGQRFDVNRSDTPPAAQRVQLDSVVLFESNRHVRETSVALLMMSGVSLAGTAYCAANPKACFGSCPTIYVGEGRSATLEAESFSSSVAPSLEATDVDALPRLPVVNGIATVHVRNEALETHNIRAMTLLAVPHAPGTQVYADELGRYWLSPRTHELRRCRGAEGDCLPALRSPGGAERSVRVDSTDLATRETLELTFPATSAQHVGLVLRSRQSLVSTFLFYQTLAWMGRSAGSWFAALERGDTVAHRQAAQAATVLGGIDVQVRNASSEWVTVATSAEHGPLAADTKVLPLPARSANDPSPIQVRLVMARGAWRLDHVALAELADTAKAVAIEPTAVLRERRSGSTPDTLALQQLRDPQQYLTTLPGDGYAVQYRVPGAGRSHRFFLAVRGHYLEWMRREWAAEENPLAAAALLANPAQAMKTLAPRFFALEPIMERTFWETRHALR